MCWHLVHNTLFDGAIVETEYVSGEVADHRWICHHFDFDCFRVFGFLDDYKVETSRPQNMLRTLEVYPGIQRATPSDRTKVYLHCHRKHTGCYETYRVTERALNTHRVIGVENVQGTLYVLNCNLHRNPYATARSVKATQTTMVLYPASVRLCSTVHPLHHSSIAEVPALQ